MDNTENKADTPSQLHAEHSSSPVDNAMSSSRDLGTAGGGSIPAGGVGNSPGGIITSDSSVNGTSSSGAVPGQGATRDRGSETSTDMQEQVPETQRQGGGGARSVIDRTAQSSIGGRSPGQPQTAMGDQDAVAGRKEATRDFGVGVDPMTSRAPDKVNQQHDKQ